MDTRLFHQAAALADDDRFDPWEPPEDDDLLLRAHEVTDAHIARANAAYDAFLQARDVRDAAMGGGR